MKRESGVSGAQGEWWWWWGAPLKRLEAGAMVVEGTAPKQGGSRQENPWSPALPSLASAFQQPKVLVLACKGPQRVHALGHHPWLRAGQTEVGHGGRGGSWRSSATRVGKSL